MLRTIPPFRADEVGSLLRPPKIKEARAKLGKGKISAEDLRKIENMEIEKVVHKQFSIGLKLATDGEFRRYGGSAAATLQPANLVATLDPSYYANPRLLWYAYYAALPPISS